MSAELARLVLQALRAPTEESRQLRHDFAATLAPELKVTPTPPRVPQSLTLAEVAKALGCTRPALQERFRRGRKAGELHPLDRAVVERDGVRRYPLAAVQAYLAAVKS